MPVDDGEIFLLHFALLPKPPQRARGLVGLGDHRHAAGFAVEPVHHVRTGFAAEMQTHAADEAGHLAVLARMTNQVGGLVDHQQCCILVDDFKKFFQRRHCAGVSPPCHSFAPA